MGEPNRGQGMMPQSRSQRLAVAILVSLSVEFYLMACLTRFQDGDHGYVVFWMIGQVCLRETLPLKLGAIWVLWMNILWCLSIICYLSKHRRGQLLFSIPSLLIVALAALILFSKLSLDVGFPPLFWASSMITCFFSGLINYSTHPRPQTSLDEDT
jgi:hypothetical protein